MEKNYLERMKYTDNQIVAGIVNSYLKVDRSSIVNLFTKLIIYMSV